MRRLLFTSLLGLALAAPAGASASTESFGHARAAGDGSSPRTALHKASAALSGGVKSAEVTPLLKELALKLPRLHGADRRRALRLLARPTPGEGTSSELEYETSEEKPLCSDHFCIHWVKTTDDAPPITDSNHNGVPDYVQTMDQVFEHVSAV
jgi:hypothetical protein